MSDPQPAPVLQVGRQALIQQGGGYLRNVRPGRRLTCKLCGGVPNGDYDTCYNCGAWVGQSGLADRLGFITYAIDGAQSGRVMYGYKSEPPSVANRQVVALMHHYAVLRHWDCFNSSTFGAITHWAVVPSLKGRAGEHPLRQIAKPLLDTKALEADLRAAARPTPTRDLRPANFLATVPHGAHVLLVEDTWVGGGRVQSAAAALKAAGATSVTALVLARWLDRRRGRTEELVEEIRHEAFDPDICPLSGVACAY